MVKSTSTHLFCYGELKKSLILVMQRWSSPSRHARVVLPHPDQRDRPVTVRADSKLKERAIDWGKKNGSGAINKTTGGTV